MALAAQLAKRGSIPLAALLKQGYGNQSSVWIKNKILSWATPGVNGANVSGTPNFLLYKGAF